MGRDSRRSAPAVRPTTKGEAMASDTSTASAAELPERFAEIVEEFLALSPADRLQLLVEFGAELPDPPARLEERRELFEQVVECQSPVYVLVELTGEDPAVQLHISAPPQAPTTRGFAGVLHAALDGAPVHEVLAVPADVSTRLGLGEAVSPLRLRGMSGMLERIKRQVAAKAG